MECLLYGIVIGHDNLPLTVQCIGPISSFYVEVYS